MKRVLIYTIAFLISIAVYAQAPQGISYQAIAFGTGGAPVSNGTVGVKVSILDGSATGTAVYVETHSKQTNAQGLFNLNIGQGSPATGVFSAIPWSTGNKFLKVEIDPAGGANYTTVGTNQLMSVPYALFAENTNADNISGFSKSAASPTGEMIVVYTSSNAYGFTRNGSSNPTWYQQSLSGTPLGAVSTDSTIVVYTTSSAYGFTRNGSGNPTWYQQSLSGTPVDASTSGKAIVVYTSSNAYSFTLNSSGNPTWYQQSLSGTPQGVTVNGNNTLVVYTSGNAYGFTTNSSGNPTWYQQSLSGTPLGATATGEFIVVYTTSNAYGFTRNGSGNPSWYQQSLSGSAGGIVPKP